MGRFLTPDPSNNSNALSIPQNWNRYAYVGGDPINKTDPFGLCSPQDNPPCYSTTVVDPGILGIGAGGGSGRGGGPPQPQAGSLLEYCDEHPELCQQRLAPGQLAPGDVPGLDEAMNRIGTDCVKAFGTKITVSTANATLAKLKYFAADLGVANDQGYTVARTNGYTVTLNGSIFFDPAHVSKQSGGTTSTGSLLPNFANVFGLNSSKFTATDFQAIYLLHELGHSLGWGDDTPSPGQRFESSSNYQHTKDIVDDCFKDKK